MLPGCDWTRGGTTDRCGGLATHLVLPTTLRIPVCGRHLDQVLRNQPHWPYITLQNADGEELAPAA